jgi:hypothetical protein
MQLPPPDWFVSCCSCNFRITSCLLSAGMNFCHVVWQRGKNIRSSPIYFKDSVLIFNSYHRTHSSKHIQKFEKKFSVNRLLHKEKHGDRLILIGDGTGLTCLSTYEGGERSWSSDGISQGFRTREPWYEGTLERRCVLYSEQLRRDSAAARKQRPAARTRDTWQTVQELRREMT